MGREEGARTMQAGQSDEAGAGDAGAGSDGAGVAGRVQGKQDLLLERLVRFYGQGDHMRVLAGLLPRQFPKAGDDDAPADGCGCDGGGVSLRILDWLVTNYAKKHNIVYLVPGEDGVPGVFNMYLEYKSQLKAFGKRFFDPFCRRERLRFGDDSGTPFYTTVGQLNFFKWALSNGVVQYGREHCRSIEDDMLRSIRHRASSSGASDGATGVQKPRRRRELSRAAIKGCTRTQVRVTVRFS